jgi:SEC-C motif-containing protein
MTSPTCYCGSAFLFEKCCNPFINGNQKAPSAEALMRSRYSAYVVQNADYLIATTHVSTRENFSKEEILNWSQQNKWQQLEVLATTETTVTFKAYFLDEKLKAQVHFEHSLFTKENGIWYYVDGTY